MELLAQRTRSFDRKVDKPVNQGALCKQLMKFLKVEANLGDSW